MRYQELVERIGGSNSVPYPFELIGVRTQTHEFEGEYRGSRLEHPVEKTLYGFDSDNGMHYIVHCNLADDTLEVSFTTMGGKTALNGQGDAFRVLSTISAIVRAYVEHEPPFQITFTASRREPGRVKLYTAMCARADQFFPGYHLESSTPKALNVYFTLTRTGAQKRAPVPHVAPPRPPEPEAAPEPERKMSPEQRQEIEQIMRDLWD